MERFESSPRGRRCYRDAVMCERRLSSVDVAVAGSRREEQAQLEFGTHRELCVPDCRLVCVGCTAVLAGISISKFPDLKCGLCLVVLVWGFFKRQ